MPELKLTDMNILEAGLKSTGIEIEYKDLLLLKLIEKQLMPTFIENMFRYSALEFAMWLSLLIKEIKTNQDI